MRKPTRKQVKITLAITSSVLRVVANQQRDRELKAIRARQREVLERLGKIEFEQTATRKRLDRAGAMSPLRQQ